MMDKLLLNSVKTPFYVFDIDELLKRVKYLASFMPDNVSLCFAMKANPFLVKELEGFVEKFEVCSYGEYKICDDLGINKKNLVISGVYKEEDEIREMIESDIKPGLFTVESLRQLELLNKLSKSVHQVINVVLRLTSGNQFGISKNEVELVLSKRVNYPYLNITGFQYFSGTQKTNIKILAKEISMLDEFLIHLEKDFGFVAEVLEYGPGFYVNYFEDSKNDDEKGYLNDFAKLIENMKYKNHITLELGRSIAARSGKYYTRVVDVKTNDEGNFAILDGGKNHFVYYGQMMAMKKPNYYMIPKRSDDNILNWNLCGSLCTVNDLIVKNLSVSNLRVGDIFVFLNTGAYSMTEGISLFLSRNLPTVIFTKGKDYRIVRNGGDIYKLNMPLERRDELWKN